MSRSPHKALKVGLIPTISTRFDLDTQPLWSVVILDNIRPKA